MCVCVYVRGCVCQHDKTKTHDRNDLKLNWHDSSPAILYPILPQRDDNMHGPRNFSLGFLVFVGLHGRKTSTESWWLRDQDDEIDS